LWQNGWMDPDAVWGGEWGRSTRNVCIREEWWSSKGRAVLGGGEFRASQCNQWGICDVLFSNYSEDLLLLARRSIERSAHVFSLPQPLNGCWCLLCQDLGYFSQPRSLNILPDITPVWTQYPSQYLWCFRSAAFWSNSSVTFDPAFFKFFSKPLPLELQQLSGSL